MNIRKNLRYLIKVCEQKHITFELKHITLEIFWPETSETN